MDPKAQGRSLMEKSTAVRVDETVVGVAVTSMHFSVVFTVTLAKAPWKQSAERTLG